MGYLNKFSKYEVENDELGYVVLRMNKLYKLVAFICIGVALLFLLVSVCLQENTFSIISGLMLIFFGGFGLVSLLYYKNHKVKFDNDTIIISNWKGAEKELRWNEIETIEYNKLVGQLKISYKDMTINIHQHLVGFDMVFKKVKEKKLLKNELN